MLKVAVLTQTKLVCFIVIFTGSVPLLLSGFVSTLRGLVNDDNSISLDLVQLPSQVGLCGPGLAASLLFLVTAVHRYNEGEASLVTAVLVTAPFTLVNLLTRLASLALLLAFLPAIQCGLLLILLTACLAVARLVLARAAPRPATTAPPEEPRCMAGRPLCRLAGVAALAAAELLAPLGFPRSPHPVWALAVNCGVVGAGMGVGLGYCLAHHAPNRYTGLHSARPGLTLEIPQTDLVLRTAHGLDIAVKVPLSEVELSSLPGLESSLALPARVAALLPLLIPLSFAVLALPVTIARLAMLGTNCVPAPAPGPAPRPASQARLIAAIACGITGGFLMAVIVSSTGLLVLGRI